MLLTTLPTSVVAQRVPEDQNRDGRLDVADVTVMVRDKASTTDITYTVDYILGKYMQEHTAVDLGLSVKWATMNLGATTVIDTGNYFAWGELYPKEDYSEAGYLYYANSTYQSIGSNICNNQKYDAAAVAWGDGWHLPTLIDINQLMSKCTWAKATLNSVNGYIVKGPNGNTIFLPAAGMKMTADGSVSQQGEDLYYWGGMASGSSAYCLNDAGYTGAWLASRAYGMPIRPVK